jgi:hypothetical protein
LAAEFEYRYGRLSETICMNVAHCGLLTLNEGSLSLAI